MDALKVAVVGCGAQADLSLLPALRSCRGVDIAVMVDKSEPNARALGDKYGVSNIADDHRKIIGSIDAAIVAVPNYLHAPVAIDLLRGGVHVLVEKPMAVKASDCDSMMDAATATGAVLAVGLDFRFFNALRFVKQALSNGLIGDVRQFDLRGGITLQEYALRTDYLLRKETAGGGVLLDLGVHFVDLLLWWFGDCVSVKYYDDAMGGVEANCEIHLQFRGGVSGIVELSRIRRLRNTCVLTGSAGTLEVGLLNPDPVVRLSLQGQPLGLSGRVVQRDEGPVGEDPYRAVFRRQFEDFFEAVTSRRRPFVPGEEGRRSVELIEMCYASREALRVPWMVEG